MTTAKKNAGFYAHPWESQLSACRDLPIALCVFDATAAISYLQTSPAVKQLANIHLVQGIFDLSEHVTAVCNGLEIADATPGLQNLFKVHSRRDMHLRFASLMTEAPLPQLLTLTHALLNSDMPPTSFYLTSAQPELGITVQLLERKTYENRILIFAQFQLATQTIHQLTQLARFEALFDAMSEFVVIVGLNGDISFRNLSAKTMLGHPDKHKNLSVKEVFHCDDDATIMRGCQDIMSGLQTWRGTLTLKGEQAVKLQCHMSAVQQNKLGEVIGFSIVGRPAIHEETLRFEVEIRDQLIENSGQLVILGQIFAQVVHELNNPLTVILGKAERIVALAEKKTSELSEYHLAAEKIIKMSRRVESIIHSMRLFSNQSQKHSLGRVSIYQVVQDVRDLIESGARKADVTVRFAEIPPDLGVHADGCKLCQILINLFTNSYDAIGGKSGAWVELQVTSDREWITLSVIDSGPGIDKTSVPKLFEAFFSTKKARRGTGIGLTLSRQIARRFGGDLYLDETAAHTTFALVLPRLAADSQKSKEENGTIVV